MIFVLKNPSIKRLDYKYHYQILIQLNSNLTSFYYRSNDFQKVEKFMLNTGTYKPFSQNLELYVPYNQRIDI